MKKSEIVAAIIAGDDEYEGIDLRPGRRFAAGAEDESHRDVRINGVPDYCAVCDSAEPRGVCFRLSAEQWVDDYMPRPRGRLGDGNPVSIRLLVPADLLKQFDAKLGGVPRIEQIRQLMQAWVSGS